MILSAPTLLTRLPLLDEILEQHAAQLGADAVAYRNHAYRVANFCSALAPAESRHAISIAAAFHDIGIWTDGTFDYLEPSRRRAQDWLMSSDHRALFGLVDAMICRHHKVTRYRGTEGPLVELFRLADRVDVSAGLMTARIPQWFLSEVFEQFPNAGFHRNLLRLTCRRFMRHPLSPLPMMQW
jgi:hypothetical protein